MIVIPDMMRTDHHNGLDGFRLVCGVLQYFSYNVTSVLLVEKTKVPKDNRRPVASH